MIQFNKQPIEFFRGDTYEAIVTVTNRGAAFNLTNYEAILSVKKYDTDSAVLVDADGEIDPDPTKGIIIFNLDETFTESLTPGKYVYDVEINDGTHRYTVVKDEMIVVADVSTPAPDPDPVPVP